MTEATIYLSRAQFGLTIAFHILFPTLNIGLALYLFAMELGFVATGKAVFRRQADFWIKVFALAFGVGVVSGVVLSYEFGLNFAKFSDRAGPILGPLMSYETLTAFFLEAGFLGIMLFGKARVGPKTHLFATGMVALGTTISAFWILAASSWMHTPAGYRIGTDGRFYVESWRAVIFNPSFPYRFAHMVCASYLTVATFLAGVFAWYLLRGRHLSFAKPGFSMALWAMAALAPLQLYIGDENGRMTRELQPLKTAAMEGRWETMRGAPEPLFAWPDTQAERNWFEIAIPKLSSLVLTHDLNGEVIGLKSASPADRPLVPVVFFAFRVMVGIGLLMVALALAGLWLRLRHTLYESRWFLWSCVFASPLGFLAVWAGWFVAECGRQPWIIYGLMRTAEAVSPLPAARVAVSLAAFALIYFALLSVFTVYLLRLIRRGPAAASARPLVQRSALRTAVRGLKTGPTPLPTE